MTALVVQSLLGGRLLRTTIGSASHYWNELPDGTEVDLTRRQFARFTPLGREYRERQYVLSFPDTSRRYEWLLRQVIDALGAES